MFREITPEDYELLLQLDEGLPCRRGAEQTASLARRIDELPTAGAPSLAGEVCMVCLVAFDSSDKVVELPCGHRYHRSCIAKWLLESRATCPLCGTQVLAT